MSGVLWAPVALMVVLSRDPSSSLCSTHLFPLGPALALFQQLRASTAFWCPKQWDILLELAQHSAKVLKASISVARRNASEAA